MINTNKLGLVLGCFFGLMHLLWALVIAIMPGVMQSFLDRIFGLHFLQPVMVITQVSFGKAIVLVLLTFVVGYIIGIIFGSLWNYAHKR